MTLVVLRLVKPATFELIILKESGMLTPKTAPNDSPVSRPFLLFSSSFQTRIIPTMEVTVFKIIIKIRVLGTKVAMAAVKARNMICEAPRGICISRDLRWEKPKLLMRIEAN